MYAVKRIGSYIARGVSVVSGPFHPFGGAVDIIVVEQPDGSFKSSPWYVTFGKFQGVLKTKEETVNIRVNGVVADIRMYLNEKGEAYFLQEAAIDGEESEPYPSSSSGCDETDQIVDRRPLKSNSFNFESKDMDLIEFSSTKIVERTNSQRSRILGPVFGRRSLKADNFDGKDGAPGVDRVDSLERAKSAADLLKLRWSTNIPAKNYRKGSSSRFNAPIIFHSESKADEVMATIDNNSVVLAYSDNSTENTSKNDAACEVPLNLGEVDVNMQFDEYKVSNVSVDDANNTRELPRLEVCYKHDKVSVDRVTISESHGEVMSEVISCTEEYVGDSVNQEVNSNVVITEDTGLVLATADLVEFEESEINTFREYCPHKVEVDFVDGDFACGKASTSQLQDLEFHKRVDPAFTTAYEISLEASASVKSGLYPQGETFELQEGNLEVDRQHCDSQTVPLGRNLRDLQQEDHAETKCSFPEASKTTNEVELENVSYISEPTEMNYSAFDVNISKDDLSKELQLNTFDSYSPESNGVDDVSSKSPRALSQKSLEDEQFQLSDIDDCKPIESVIARTASTDIVNQGTTLPVSMGSCEQTDASDRDSSTDGENSKGKRENVSSAINIIKGQTVGSEEGTLLKTNAKRMVRVMMPTSDQLASLNLKEGCNSIAFSFRTAMLGTQQVNARIYLWKWNTQVIISDVDGTITKSDILGHFMPLVGMDWLQTGVAHLYSAIKDNGYQLLFLSARAISQAYHTRQFLFNLKQDGKSLPDGPVVISPDGLFSSFYRGAIRGTPHEFKIPTLQDIRDLFPADHNPFYAGFGNRQTDEISYGEVGIPKGKIFTINPKGEIAINKHIKTWSYTTLHAVVNGMFPPVTSFDQVFIHPSLSSSGH